MKKSNEIWVCADFSTGLNAALKEYHYPLPSPDEVFSKLNGGTIFSKIDLSDAYLQVPMEENSSRLLCINTHRGLVRKISVWREGRTGDFSTGNGHHAGRS